MLRCVWSIASYSSKGRDAEDECTATLDSEDDDIMIF